MKYSLTIVLLNNKIYPATLKAYNQLIKVETNAPVNYANRKEVIDISLRFFLI